MTIKKHYNIKILEIFRIFAIFICYNYVFTKTQKTKGYALAFKENIDHIKNELNAQEQVLENFIKGERFIKKYKYYFLALILIIIVAVVYNFIQTSINEKEVQANNALYASLLQDPSDEASADKLKANNANLYALFLVNTQQDNNLSEKLSQINPQTLDPLFQKIIALNQDDFSFLPEYQKLMQAYELLKQNKVKEAHAILAQIPLDSPLQQIIQNLKHYQG